MTSHVIFLPVVLMAGAGLFAWFYRLAAVNRQITIVTLILGLIAIETALYEKITVPTGIFHPATGLFQVRTIDVVILIAVVANAAAGGRPRIVNRTAFFWVVFGIWMLTEGFIGFLNGNSGTRPRRSCISGCSRWQAACRCAIRVPGAHSRDSSTSWRPSWP